MPNAPWPMTEESLWYSINIGHAHFISINTESLNPDTELGMKQLEWLRQDLLEANRFREFQPWIIVMGHKPLYCTKSVMEQTCDKENSPLRDVLEDIFYEHGVDIYFSGHKHCYERSWPLYNGKVFQNDYINPMAPVYIIIGSMGYEYILDLQRSDPYWLAFASADKSKELFGRLIVHNSTSLLWSVHAAASNEEVDKIFIKQKSHGSFGTPGPGAFERKQEEKSNREKLPQEPFYIVDPEVPWHFQYRRILLSLFVFCASLVLFLFLRHSKVRKILRL